MKYFGLYLLLTLSEMEMYRSYYARTLGAARQVV